MLSDLAVADAPFDGRWWAPERPKKVVGGRLYLEDEIWSLKLFGWLGDGPPKRDENTRPTVIHGQIGTTSITLLNLVGKGWTGWGEPTESEFVANTVLCGIHCEENIEFSAAQTWMVNLEEWGRRAPFDLRADDDGQMRREMTVFEFPPVLTATLVGGRARLYRSLFHKENRFHSVEMTSHEVVHFEFDAAQTLGDVEFEYVRPLRNLIELAAMERCATLGLRVLPFGGDPARDWVQVLSGIDRRPAPPTPKHYFELLLSLDDIPFETLLPTWWKVHRELQMIPDLFLSLYDRGYVGVLFNTAASVLEGYHRHRDRSKGEGYAYAERLDDLVGRAAPIFASVVGDVEKWKHWVKDERNSVAHRFPASMKVEIEWETTARVTESIRLLLSLLLIEDAGLSEDQRRQAMKRSREAERVGAGMRCVLPQWFC